MKNNIASLLSVTAAVALTTLGAAPVLAQQATPGTTGSITATRGATEKPSGTVSTNITSTATVAKIDKKDRWITLKMADGSMVDIQAGPAVKNFAQIKVGDLVTASQEETLAIAVVAGRHRTAECHRRLIRRERTVGCQAHGRAG
jgi:hypothetical protein